MRGRGCLGVEVKGLVVSLASKRYQTPESPHKQTNGGDRASLRCHGNFAREWPTTGAAGLSIMRLFVGALVTVAVGWGVVLASPTPARRSDRTHARAQAEHACRARGPTCRLVVKAGAPRNPGAACVCD